MKKITIKGGILSIILCIVAMVAAWCSEAQVGDKWFLTGFFCIVIGFWLVALRDVFRPRRFVVWAGFLLFMFVLQSCGRYTGCGNGKTTCGVWYPKRFNK